MTSGRAGSDRSHAWSRQRSTRLWRNARRREAHLAAYDYTPSHPETEIVTLRARGTASPGTISWASTNGAGEEQRVARVWLGGEWREVPVHHREGLPDEVTGPLLVEQEDTTILIAEGWRARRAQGDNLVMEREGGS